MGLYLASDACLGDIDYRSKVEKQFKDKPYIMGIIGKIIGGIIAFIILTSIISSCSGSCSCSGGCCSCGDSGSYYNREVTASGTVYVDVYCNGSKLETKTVRFTEYDDGSKYASYSDSTTSNLKLYKEYYVFKGIFRNLDKTDQIIDSYGYYNGGFSAGATYYAILDPQDEGVEYTINYYSSKPNETAKFVSAEKINVGNSFMLPAGGIDEFDGLDFIGGFMGSANGTMIIDEDRNIVNGYEDFYLHNFTSANTTEKSLNVILLYETKKAKITFINDEHNINKMVKMEYGSTLAEAFVEAMLIVAQDTKLDSEKYALSGIGYYAYIPATEAELEQDKIYDDVLTLYLFISEKKTLTLIPVIDGVELTDSKVTKTVFKGDIEILSNPEAQPGYKFIGWYDNKQFNGSSFQSITITDDITLYGKFDTATYTIKYCYGSITPSGYSENQQFDSTTYSYSKENDFQLKKISEVANVKGYSVVGWSYNKDGSESIGTSLPAETYGDIVLYPSYEAAKFTVYIMNSAYATVNTNSYEITYNKAFRLPVPTVTDSTKEFVGYQTEAGLLITDSNGNSKFTFNETNLGCTYDELNDMFIEIKTDTKKYTVKFMDGAKTVDTKKVEAGQAVSETTEVLDTRAGMTFDHWSLTENGTAYDFTNTVSSDLTLYAVFTYNTYKVYLYDTDKTTLLKTIDVTYNSSWSITGISANGWKTVVGDKNVALGDGTVVGTYSPYKIEGDLSIYKK